MEFGVPCPTPSFLTPILRTEGWQISLPTNTLILELFFRKTLTSRIVFLKDGEGLTFCVDCVGELWF